MKVVLSGSTGYIGGGVLTQCLDHPAITTLLILTRRRPADLAENSKAKVLIIKDFTSYDDAIAEELKTADAAIWCLGTSTGDERVDIDFPLAFIDLIKARPAGSKLFRYIQLSGAFTEPPPAEGQKERSLWFYANGRRIRGATEARVLASAEGCSPNEFTVTVVKPGGVMPKSAAVLQKCIFGNTFSIEITDLATTMVDLAIHGSQQQVFSNQQIIEHARKLPQRSN